MGIESYCLNLAVAIIRLLNQFGNASNVEHSNAQWAKNLRNVLIVIH